MTLFIRGFVFTAFILSSHLAYSSNSAKLLSFSQWKQAQSLKAKNQMARATNRLTMAKKTDLSSAKKVLLQKEVARAEQSFELSKDYTIEDYFLVYLSSDELAATMDKQALFQNAAALLSKEEVAKMMEMWLESIRPQASSTPALNTGFRLRKNSVSQKIQ